MTLFHRPCFRFLILITLVCLLSVPESLTTAQNPFKTLQNKVTQATGSSSGQQAILARKGWIRVSVGSAASATVTVSGGSYTVLANGAAASSGSGTVRLSARGGTISAAQGSRHLASAREITIVPSMSNGLVGIGERNYRGRCVAIANGSGMTLVNEVQIDDFLKGMLDAEIGSDAPLEALKAQTICARSELVHKLIKPPHHVNGYDFCNGTHCMAYKGVSGENQQCVQAVRETIGLVLVANGDVLDAVFHNVCGGTTAGAEEVWDSKRIAGLTPVLDNGRGNSAPDLSSDRAATAFIEKASPSLCCNPSQPGYPNYAKKYFRWQKTLSFDQISRITGVGAVNSVQVTERMHSGRVRKLQVSGSRGTKTYVKELPIRNAFDLWSGFFVVTMGNGGVTFTGAGNGHGVGLCQMGARSLAANGADYKQILKHYFPEASIQRIYRP